MIFDLVAELVTYLLGGGGGEYDERIRRVARFESRSGRRAYLPVKGRARFQRGAMTPVLSASTGSTLPAKAAAHQLSQTEGGEWSFVGTEKYEDQVLLARERAR